MDIFIVDRVEAEASLFFPSWGVARGRGKSVPYFLEGLLTNCRKSLVRKYLGISHFLLKAEKALPAVGAKETQPGVKETIEDQMEI